jgi:uncharacterized NAD(P)/FAD-binding protein YdhS
MPTIAIVGGGVTGALLAWQLVKRGPKGMSVAVIEQRDRLGLGQAYSTDEPTHLLNIPAGRMTALPGRPTAFADYLEARSDLLPGDVPTAEAYAPRQVFGQFVGELVREALSARGGAKLQQIRGTALDIRDGERQTIVLSDGRLVTADTAVLAPGNPPPPHPDGAGSWLHENRFYRHDPWAPNAFEDVPDDAAVLFLGTGLTMIDCVLSLVRRGHRGPITAVSRRGLLPQHHEPGPRVARDLPFDPERPPGAAALLRAMRTRARRAERDGHDWRGVMDGLRGAAQDIWRNLPEPEQARFLRHARSWWEVHRHRVAPGVWAIIEPLLASGRLRTLAARVGRYAPADGGIEITAARRGTSEEIRLHAGLLVNCTGPNMDLMSMEHPLLVRLAARGRIRPGPHRLGIDVGDDLSVIGKDGNASSGLYAIGPLLRGRYWEITSVPEIGRHAAALADTLVRRHAVA